MVAFALLRASSILIGFLSPVVLAGLTPLGSRELHVVSSLNDTGPGNQLRYKNSLLKSAATANSLSSIGDGYGAFASWRNNDSLAISSVIGSWIVPNPPTNYTGQTLFLYNGVISTADDAAFIPALQYGNTTGDGPHWSVKTFFIYSDIAWCTPEVKVYPGDILQGAVKMINATSTFYFYEASFVKINGTSFQFSLPVFSAFDQAREGVTSFNATGPLSYPAKPAIFSSINVRLLKNITPVVHWTAVSDPQDGLDVTIDLDGATEAQISVAYPKA